MCSQGGPVKVMSKAMSHTLGQNMAHGNHVDSHQSQLTIHGHHGYGYGFWRLAVGWRTIGPGNGGALAVPSSSQSQPMFDVGNATFFSAAESSFSSKKTPTNPSTYHSPTARHYSVALPPCYNRYNSSNMDVESVSRVVPCNLLPEFVSSKIPQETKHTYGENWVTQSEQRL